MTLTEFKKRIEPPCTRLGGLLKSLDLTEVRPFVCDGSPFCEVFVVGYNPATPMPGSFWGFWDPLMGFDYSRWLTDYGIARLAAGKKRSSHARKILDVVRRTAGNTLEANLYPIPTYPTEAFLDAMAALHAQAQEIIRQHLAHLGADRCLLMKFNRRFRPSSLLAELIAQHTAVGPEI